MESFFRWFIPYQPRYYTFFNGCLFCSKVVNLPEDFSKTFASLAFAGGLLVFALAVIMSEKGKHD